MKKLYEDYKDLHKRYSVIDLGWKGEKILKSFKISERKIFKVKGNENLILEIMKENHISVNQLAAKINMTRQGVRYHIHNLLKQKKIRLIDYKQLNWKYGI
jgi:predicted HTH transcriptional regulator